MGYSINRGIDMNKNVKELRGLSGLSQSQFSKEFNIPIRTLQKWESGDRKPPDYIVELVCESLLYRGLLEPCDVFGKENNDMINETLKTYFGTTVEELNTIDIKEWTASHPNRCALVILNDDGKTAKIVVQTALKGKSAMEQRKNLMFPDNDKFAVISQS